MIGNEKTKHNFLSFSFISIKIVFICSFKIEVKYESDASGLRFESCGKTIIFKVHISMQKNELRIKKEFDEFAKTVISSLSQSEKSTVKVSLYKGDIRHWKGYIEGPDDTPYKSGFFQIDIQLPPEYPYKPPKMKF